MAVNNKAFFSSAPRTGLGISVVGGGSGGSGGGITNVTFNTSDGILSFDRLGLPTITVDLDGRYLQDGDLQNLALDGIGNLSITDGNTVDLKTVFYTEAEIDAILANYATQAFVLAQNYTTLTEVFSEIDKTYVDALLVDAATLDGLDSATTATINTIVARDASGNIYANAFFGNGANITGVNADQLGGVDAVDYALDTDIPTLTSQLINDSSFAVANGSSTFFLKADGSFDTNTYLTSADLSNYLDLTATGDQIMSGALRIEPSGSTGELLRVLGATSTGSVETKMSIGQSGTIGSFVELAAGIVSGSDPYFKIYTRNPSSPFQQLESIKMQGFDVTVTNLTVSGNLTGTASNSNQLGGIDAVDYALDSDIPTLTSQLTNDSNFAVANGSSLFFLKADGSFDTNTYLTTADLSDYLDLTATGLQTTAGYISINTTSNFAALTVGGGTDSFVGSTNVSTVLSDLINSTLVVSHPTGNGNTVVLVGSSQIALATTDGTTTTERMRVLSSGNIAIGQTTASERLEVNGNVKATQFVGTADNSDQLGGVDSVNYARTDITESFNAGINVSGGDITVTGADIVTNGFLESGDPNGTGTARGFKMGRLIVTDIVVLDTTKWVEMNISGVGLVRLAVVSIAPPA